MIAVLLADGFEEIEALTPVDMLRRSGLEVVTVGISSRVALGSHGIPVICDRLPSEEEVRAVISRFVGEIEQTPPMYSALKIGGKKLCDLAREGVTVEREKRQITVYSIDTERISDSDYSLTVHCSKGTYIRTLCADIGAALCVGGAMAALCRTEASGFTLSDAKTLSELEEMTEEERLGCVIPIEKLFREEREVYLPPFFARLARCGAPIYIKKIGLELDLGTRVKLFDEKGFFALGEAEDTPDGRAIRPIRQFDV